MLKFIVLGYVPGTTFQISFGMYIIFFLCAGWLTLSSWYALTYMTRQQALRIASLQLLTK